MDPFICGDSDGDSCDDCGALAGQEDLDGDGICNLNDTDDDGDGVGDDLDPSPLDPSICGDLDGDGCDDCASVDDTGDFDGDGVCDASDPDTDGDGVCDGPLAVEGVCVSGPDSNPFDPTRCSDEDQDGCDECSSGSVEDTNNDGADADGDGICDLGDTPDAEDDDDDVIEPIASQTGPLSLMGGGCSTSGGSPAGSFMLAILLLLGIMRRTKIRS